MRFWDPKHFDPWELVPPEIHQAKGEDSILAFDARILWTLDAIRDVYDRRVTVNTWHEGGKFSQRGFRTDPAMLLKTPLTQHRFGRAVDFDIEGITPEQFRADAREPKLANVLQYVTRIEVGKEVTWNHVDCMAVPGTEIVFFTV